MERQGMTLVDARQHLRSTLILQGALEHQSLEFAFPHKSGRGYGHPRECELKVLLALCSEGAFAGDSSGRKLQVQWSDAKPSKEHKK